MQYPDCKPLSWADELLRDLYPGYPNSPCFLSLASLWAKATFPTVPWGWD